MIHDYVRRWRVGPKSNQSAVRFAPGISDVSATVAIHGKTAHAAGIENQLPMRRRVARAFQVVNMAVAIGSVHSQSAVAGSVDPIHIRHRRIRQSAHSGVRISEEHSAVPSHCAAVPSEAHSERQRESARRSTQQSRSAQSDKLFAPAHRDSDHSAADTAARLNRTVHRRRHSAVSSHAQIRYSKRRARVRVES